MHSIEISYHSLGVSIREKIRLCTSISISSISTYPTSAFVHACLYYNIRFFLFWLTSLFTWHIFKVVKLINCKLFKLVKLIKFTKNYYEIDRNCLENQVHCSCQPPRGWFPPIWRNSKLQYTLFAQFELASVGLILF